MVLPRNMIHFGQKYDTTLNDITTKLLPNCKIFGQNHLDGLSVKIATFLLRYVVCAEICSFFNLKNDFD
jgi:hypothetical protein